MTTSLVIMAAVLVVTGALLAWIRLHRWRAEEQDTRLLTGIVDLRRSFRDGRIDVRLPAAGRGFTRDVEMAVNKLLDEVVGQLRARDAKGEALTRAFDALAGAVARTVERVEAVVVQIDGLGAELARQAGAEGDDAVAGARAGDDERFADQCQTAAALADESRAAASECEAAFVRLRARLTELADETAGLTRGLEAAKARWAAVRRGADDVARVAATTEVLAVNAALAAGRDADAREDLDRLAAEIDEVAHGVSGGLGRITSALTAYEEGMARVLDARNGARPDDSAEVDGSLARLQALPSRLAELARGLAGVAGSRAPSVDAGELQTWTGLAERVGQELAQATGTLTAARREAQRLLGTQATP